MNSWLNQKRFGGNNKIAGVSVNLGATKGRGSSTRVFNYCKQTSKDPSQCINQFITIQSSGSSGCANIENISLSSIATESPSGTWTLKSNTTITICQSLTVGDDDTLIITEGLTLTNYGTITNNGGTITNDGGTIINNGIINNGGESTINIDLNSTETVGGIMTNNGTINNDGVIRCLLGVETAANTINNSGSFYNNFKLYIEPYSTFTNLSGGTFNNNDGSDCHINSFLYNDTGSTFNNLGNISSTVGLLSNSGIFNNSNTIVLDGSSSISNSGTFTNSGAISMVENVSINNLGTFNNSNTINLNEGTSISNSGTFNNNSPDGELSLGDGCIFYNTNGGTIIQSGTFTNSGTIYNPIGSLVCGTGTITGSVTGTIIDACGPT
jgi:hypothetical protein